MNKILVLGVGPGSPDYVLPIIYEKAGQCDILFGGRRNLELFKNLNKETVVIRSHVEEVISRLKEARRVRRPGVLVSGDPGLYSFLTTLRQHFGKDDLEVYPGISSLQYLFARGALPWQDACIISLHGRRLEDLAGLVKTRPKVAFFTDQGFPAGEIARFLVENGVRGKRGLVGEDLSYPTERVLDLPLEKLAGQAVSNLSVMVVYDDQ
ncbi:MAG: precorrin-6y C5,15-methyltransferase (decarboxylating) subunit CbiE [Peptococcaceae bacterium]|nr:precorrin-6y C5,15-methyltransferase (decarboxylating) subunit CbiE [Peptococcaceae bacterium]MDH7525791.1 precorrin-6y C5,15-methyltransferase (decarboxylating) subunit CbiE [Peptococcaceae bacterium]